MMEVLNDGQLVPPQGAMPLKDQTWLKENLDNEEGVLQFLDDPTNNLEDQPTEVLIELAQKLKERRTAHYEDMLKIQQEQDKKAKEEQEQHEKYIQDKQNEL